MAILKNSFIHIYTHAHSKIFQHIILTFLLLLDIFIGLIIDELVKGQKMWGGIIGYTNYTSNYLEKQSCCRSFQTHWISNDNWKIFFLSCSNNSADVFDMYNLVS